MEQIRDKENGDGKRQRLSLGKKPPSPAAPSPLGVDRTKPAGLQPRVSPSPDTLPDGLVDLRPFMCTLPPEPRGAPVKPLCAPECDLQRMAADLQCMTVPRRRPR